MRWIKTWFRKRYEARVNLRFGYLQFLGNFASLQLTPEEYVDLNSPSKRTGDIRITSNDARPMLAFKYWPPGKDWSEDLPVVRLILEEKRIMLSEQESEAPAIWDNVELTHPIVNELKDLFLAFAFFPSMRPEHKKKKRKKKEAAHAETT